MPLPRNARSDSSWIGKKLTADTPIQGLQRIDSYIKETAPSGRPWATDFGIHINPNDAVAALKKYIPGMK